MHIRTSCWRRAINRSLHTDRVNGTNIISENENSPSSILTDPINQANALAGKQLCRRRRQRSREEARLIARCSAARSRRVSRGASSRRLSRALAAPAGASPQKSSDASGVSHTWRASTRPARAAASERPRIASRAAAGAAAPRRARRQASSERRREAAGAPPRRARGRPR